MVGREWNETDRDIYAEDGVLCHYVPHPTVFFLLDGMSSVARTVSC